MKDHILSTTTVRRTSMEIWAEAINDNIRRVAAPWIGGVTVALLILAAPNTTSTDDATFAICDGSPTEPSNRVIVIGSDTAIGCANTGVILEDCDLD